MLDKGPHGSKVLAINVNVKVTRAFNCSRDENLGIMSLFYVTFQGLKMGCHRKMTNLRYAQPEL